MVINELNELRVQLKKLQDEINKLESRIKHLEDNAVGRGGMLLNELKKESDRNNNLT